MSDVELMIPALAFLLTGVPLAALLERLGYFDSVIAWLVGPDERQLRVVWLWILAASTTVVMNLDTTIVLLTPLYIALARSSGIAVRRLALISLLLASFASSLLPVSNLSNLILLERAEVTIGRVVGEMIVPTSVACVVGWFLYARRWGSSITVSSQATPDGTALRLGHIAVVSLLVGFIAGPSVGVDAWLVALVIDVALIVRLKYVPWRRIPILTAVGVFVVGAILLSVVPDGPLRRLDETTSPLGLAGVTLLGAVAANLFNNLPTVLVMAGASDDFGRGSWAWLRGLNIGAVVLPIGALANLLWLRIMRADDQAVGWGRYVRDVAPIAVPVVVVTALVEFGIQAL